MDAGDELCLGLHLEGPFLNRTWPARSRPRRSVRSISLRSGSGLPASGASRDRLARDPKGSRRHRLVAAAGVVAGGPHEGERGDTRAAINAGARFATHVWNAMGPIRSRATGPVPELLLDKRVTLGLIGDSRHLHPRIEELTIRAAGADRIALTSDQVAPAQLPDGRLLGGDRCGRSSSPGWRGGSATRRLLSCPASCPPACSGSRTAAVSRPDSGQISRSSTRGSPARDDRGGYHLWSRGHRPPQRSGERRSQRTRAVYSERTLDDDPA